LRVLHLQSSFDRGGKELRTAKLIDAFGDRVSHTIVSAQRGALAAAAAIDPRIAVSYPSYFPPLAGKPLPARLHGLARAMAGFDLVLTYNWGAMDAVMAYRLFGGVFRLPPLVHHEDGFNEDEAQVRKGSRNRYRRIALGRASALVVPSRRLETIALEEWRQPPGRVVRIANGIDTAAYAGAASPDALPGLAKRPGERWLGTLAGLRAVKNLPRLVRAFAGLPETWRLVILGEGPEREAILGQAARLNVAQRVHLPGFIARPAAVVGLFDLFALSSDSEQFPISVVEAMAAGLAVASSDVGDVAAMVADANRPYVTPAGDEAAFAAALFALAGSEGLRESIGRANRDLARAEYDEKAMIAAYCKVYARALGRAAFP
jgi:L-malate glycosyltransferase